MPEKNLFLLRFIGTIFLGLMLTSYFSGCSNRESHRIIENKRNYCDLIDSLENTHNQKYPNDILSIVSDLERFTKIESLANKGTYGIWYDSSFFYSDCIEWAIKLNCESTLNMPKHYIDSLHQLRDGFVKYKESLIIRIND